MRFLCLHGRGANSHIMEMQTAALRHSLADGHTYEFVEAVWQVPMADGLEAISSGDSPFFAFYNPQDLSTLQDTIKQLEHYIVQEGPFDVLMGFSEGAVLAATYLLTQKAGQVGSIKAAIFLSSAETADELEYMGIDPSKASIKIPTAHVWGSSDRKAPSGGKDLAALCEPIMCLTLVHDGGHELPKKEALTKAVHTIRRTLQNVN